MAQEEFIRVGTTLYKIVNQPRINGGFVKKRIVWNNETLRQDYGKDFIATVPKYDGFCTVPNHVNYQPVVDKFLNLYEPIGHQPKEGEFLHIESLIRHIFGEQYELGMDYLQLLYLQPVQKLPILLMVSEERNTGKSTFLNFLKAVFQNNVTFNTNEDFRSQFNADWAGKLLIVVDEVLLNRREDSERLKNLSTTLSYKVEARDAWKICQMTFGVNAIIQLANLVTGGNYGFMRRPPVLGDHGLVLNYLIVTILMTGTLILINAIVKSSKKRKRTSESV